MDRAPATGHPRLEDTRARRQRTKPRRTRSAGGEERVSRDPLTRGEDPLDSADQRRGDHVPPGRSPRSSCGAFGGVDRRESCGTVSDREVRVGGVGSGRHSCVSYTTRKKGIRVRGPMSCVSQCGKCVVTRERGSDASPLELSWLARPQSRPTKYPRKNHYTPPTQTPAGPPHPDTEGEEREGGSVKRRREGARRRKGETAGRRSEDGEEEERVERKRGEKRGEEKGKRERTTVQYQYFVEANW